MRNVLTDTVNSIFLNQPLCSLAFVFSPSSRRFAAPKLFYTGSICDRYSQFKYTQSSRWLEFVQKTTEYDLGNGGIFTSQINLPATMATNLQDDVIPADDIKKDGTILSTNGCIAGQSDYVIDVESLDESVASVDEPFMVKVMLSENGYIIKEDTQDIKTFEPAPVNVKDRRFAPLASVDEDVDGLPEEVAAKSNDEICSSDSSQVNEPPTAVADSTDRSHNTVTESGNTTISDSVPPEIPDLLDPSDAVVADWIETDRCLAVFDKENGSLGIGMTHDYSTSSVNLLGYDSVEKEWSPVKKYHISSWRPGHVIILQMENFSHTMMSEYGLTARPEAEVDARDLTFRLRHDAFHVRLVKDPTRDEFLNLIQDSTTPEKLDPPERLDATSCFMVIIMTHAVQRKGDPTLVYAMYDGFVARDEIITPIVNCSALHGKPKMFIFQACKSSGKVENYNVTLTRSPSVRRAAISDIPANFINQSSITPPDVLLVESFVTGYMVFKNARSGSFFLQLLIKALEFNVVNPGMDLVKLLVRVNDQVATSTASLDLNSPDGFDPHRPSPAWAGHTHVSHHKRRQTIIVTSTLTKLLCLFDGYATR